ncbi:MAG TPA: M23 family metallopeptidase [bacterium]|nr:M23 family metallopeptidase [bacterium]
MFITKPLRKIFKFIFRKILLPIYNILHLTKKQTRISVESKGGGKLSILITSKFFLYLTFIFVAIIILTNNFIIKGVAAEDLGKKSVFYKLAQGNEFDEIIVEESQMAGEKIINNLALNNSASEPFAYNLEKNAVAEDFPLELEENIPAEGLIANNLQKNSGVNTNSNTQVRTEVEEYIVQSGETVSTIAKKFNISVNTILWANNLSANSLIKPGNKLIILPVSGVLHQVKKGDTLSALVKKYGVEVNKILASNQIISEEQISIGQNLIIPGGEIKKSTPASTNSLASNLRSKSNESKAGGYIWPTSARYITQYFGWRHNGLDIAGPLGTPIYAAKPGKVITAGWNSGGYGNYIILQHTDGTKTLYGHMTKLYVKAGNQVEQGETIGAMGSTGRSTGPHLHFEIIINGKRVNPLSYF